MGTALPQWFAMTVLPLDEVSTRQCVVQSPAPGAALVAGLPVPLLHLLPGQPGSPARVGSITDVYVDGGELRACGRFDHATMGGRNLALRVWGGELVPVAAHLLTPAFDFELAKMLREEAGEEVTRYTGWRLDAVRADPPGGAAWPQALLWRI